MSYLVANPEDRFSRDEVHSLDLDQSEELSDLGLHYLPRPVCRKISNHYVIIAV